MILIGRPNTSGYGPGVLNPTQAALLQKTTAAKATAAAQPKIDENNLLARIDRLYGISKPNDTLANVHEAATNLTGINDVITGQRNAALTEGGTMLNGRFSNAWRTGQQKVGAAGLAGGSADRSARRKMLASLFQGRNSLVLGADAAGRAARSGMDSRRMELARQVKLGTAPNLDTMNTIGDQRSAVDEAYRGLGDNALGDLLVNAGQTYYTGQEAAGAGRAGPSAFSLTRRRPSTTGTYLS